MRRLNVVQIGWYSSRSGAIRRKGHRHNGHCAEPCPWTPLYVERGKQNDPASTEPAA